MCTSIARKVPNPKSQMQDRAEWISMSNARDAAVQQTFHTSPTLFTGLEIGTISINFLALVAST